MSEQTQDTQRINWWAQQLQQAYVEKRRAIDHRFKGLGGEWANPAKWINLANKVMFCGLQPADAMDTILQSCQSKIPPPFELSIGASSPIFAGLTRVNAMTPEEAQEMIDLKLNPNTPDDVSFYYLRQKLKYWHRIIARSAETDDATSNAYCDSLVDGFSGAPPWVCYLLNPKREEVFLAYSDHAFKFFMSNPATGYAAIRLGFHKEMIYPNGSPYGN